MCNYLVQNFILLGILLIYFFFFVRKNSMVFKYDKKDTIRESWNKLAGSNSWFFLGFCILSIIVCIINKVQSISIILKLIGIEIC